MTKKIVAIVQARLGSTRLPNKIFMQLASEPMIYHVCNRLKQSKFINQVIIATTDQDRDDTLFQWAAEQAITCYRGSEDNVLKRFYEAAANVKADIIVRITGDDPFKDITIIDEVIKMLITEDLDLACNNFPPSFPEGLDVEVFTFNSLKKASENSIDNFEKEHVTQYFYRNPELFKIKNYSYKEDLSQLRLTVDTQNDFLLAENIYNKLYVKNELFGLNQILSLWKSDIDLFEINQRETRSAMYKKNEFK